MLEKREERKRKIVQRDSKFARFAPSGDIPEMSPEGTKRDP
jgi:hypothetical protein